MDVTPLEHEILSWIRARHPNLGSYLEHPEVFRRDETGVGFFTYLTDKTDGWEGVPAERVDGPYIRSPSLESGAGSILWLTEGVPVCLETYAYGSVFPNPLVSYELVDSDPTV